MHEGREGPEGQPGVHRLPLLTPAISFAQYAQPSSFWLPFLTTQSTAIVPRSSRLVAYYSLGPGSAVARLLFAAQARLLAGNSPSDLPTMSVIWLEQRGLPYHSC